MRMWNERWKNSNNNDMIWERKEAASGAAVLFKWSIEKEIKNGQTRRISSRISSRQQAHYAEHRAIFKTDSIIVYAAVVFTMAIIFIMCNISGNAETDPMTKYGRKSIYKALWFSCSCNIEKKNTLYVLWSKGGELLLFFFVKAAAAFL